MRERKRGRIEREGEWESERWKGIMEMNYGGREKEDVEGSACHEAAR